MPRCPLCGSSRITVVVSLYPRAFCSACGARWVQDGIEQRAIGRVQEPAFMAPAPVPPIARRATLASGPWGSGCVSW
jgi:hypothetical protein